MLVKRNEINFVQYFAVFWHIIPNQVKMDPRSKQKVTTHQQYLCENIVVTEILPLLFQEKVKDVSDKQRINHETSDGDKIKKLLGILEQHQNGFKALCKALRETEMDFIADTLEKTQVNEQEIEKGNQRQSIVYVPTSKPNQSY